MRVEIRRGTPAEVRAALFFLAPGLAVIVVFFFLPIAASLLLSATDFDLYALADPSNARVTGVANYRALALGPGLPDRAQEHARLRPPREPAHGRRRALGRPPRERPARAGEGLLPDDVLRAGRHDARRRRGRLQVRLPPALRPPEPRAHADRPPGGGLARRSAVRALRDRPPRRLEELRVLDDPLRRGPAGHPRVPLRGGAPRRGRPLAAVPADHAAAARADDAPRRVSRARSTTSSSSPSPTS